MRTLGEFTVREGDRVPFTLTWFPSNEDLPKAISAEDALQDTVDYWEEWADMCAYKGRWGQEVHHSLVVLKALTYAPTGGIVAAATTSLPEKVGGERNWDYRFCWLRDATLTLLAFINAGYLDEARAWRTWLLRAAAGDPAALQIMYGVAGERRLTEITLDWLPGYERSRPVRVGNAASEQFQLDVFGEVLDAMHQGRVHELERLPEAWSLQRRLLRHLEDAWKEPDEGLWEVRGPRRHFTHSKVMAWVAFDRGIQAVERFGRTGPADRWREIRAEIHREVCERGFDVELNSIRQYYG
jgi:GH15 family glucan-1,4-alpha-glucosidase